MSDNTLPSAEIIEGQAGAKAQLHQSGKGVSGLALVLAIVALAAAGWSAWQLQQQQAQGAQQLAHLQAVGQTLTEQLQGSERQVAQRLAGLPSQTELGSQRDLLLSLQAEQQRLAQNLTEILGQSRQHWRLAEAEHLLRLAMLRLSALHDIHGALALVEGADEILRAQSDPKAFATRAQLIKVLEELRSLPEVDRSGLFLQLAALREKVAALQALAPEFIAQQDVAESPAVPVVEDFWDSLWREASRHVRIDLDANHDVKPHLAGQTLAQVRLALSLALEQAQWAALNGKPEVYQSALAGADQLLVEFFDTHNQAVQALRTRLNTLAEVAVVTPMPDLSEALSSLQAYLKSRETTPVVEETEQ